VLGVDLVLLRDHKAFWRDDGLWMALVLPQGPGKVADCPDWMVLGQARRAG
jgi:hypothetical protein